MNVLNPDRSWLERAAPWILHHQVSVYLQGREKPMTGLTVQQVNRSLLVARWNSSTHIIPTAAIVAIRFSPDCDPCRDPDHPLHSVVSRHADGRPIRRPPGAPKPNLKPGTHAVADVLTSLGVAPLKPEPKP